MLWNLHCNGKKGIAYKNQLLGNDGEIRCNLGPDIWETGVSEVFNVIKHRETAMEWEKQSVIRKVLYNWGLYNRRVLHANCDLPNEMLQSQKIFVRAFPQCGQKASISQWQYTGNRKRDYTWHSRSVVGPLLYKATKNIKPLRPLCNYIALFLE
jgi:hypothetical protein